MISTYFNFLIKALRSSQLHKSVGKSEEQFTSTDLEPTVSQQLADRQPTVDRQSVELCCSSLLAICLPKRLIDSQELAINKSRPVFPPLSYGV